MANQNITARTPWAHTRPDRTRLVDDEVRERLTRCVYAAVFRKVTWQYMDHRLTLRGGVPSFYLKQLLQELLRGIEGVKSIVNDVDVVSATGLSSEHIPKPR